MFSDVYADISVGQVVSCPDNKTGVVIEHDKCSGRIKVRAWTGELWTGYEFQVQIVGS